MNPERENSLFHHKGVCKIKPVSIPAWTGGAHGTLSLAKELLAIYGAGRVIFLLGCGNLEVAHSPMDVSIPMHVQAALTELNGLFN